MRSPKSLEKHTCALYGSFPQRYLKVGLSPLIMPVLVCACVCARVCVRAHLSPPVTPDVSACEVRPSSHADTCTGGPRPPGKDEGRGQRSKVRWLARSRLRLWTKGASVSEGRSFIIRCPAADVTARLRSFKQHRDSLQSRVKQTQLQQSCSVKRIKRCFPRSFRANLMWRFGFFRSN